MKKPFAYITAVWKGGEFTVIDQAAVYCRKVYEAGFTPICPVLYLPHFLRDSIPAEHKDGIDIGRELLRRSHVLIVCGDEVDESVKNDIHAVGAPFPCISRYRPKKKRLLTKRWNCSARTTRGRTSEKWRWTATLSG